MPMQSKKLLKYAALAIVAITALSIITGKFGFENVKSRDTKTLDFHKELKIFQSTTVRRYQHQKFVQDVKNVPADKPSVNMSVGTNRMTNLSDIFISVKSTFTNHRKRLKILLDTWIPIAQNQTYIFTDGNDQELMSLLPENHVINTNCSVGHNRRSLVCRMGYEFDGFILSGKRWFCHVDDDNYLNVNVLVSVLRNHSHTTDWYLGKPSLNHPLETLDRSRPGQKIAFWFGTGGAGFCISRSLAMKMLPYAGGGRLMKTSEQIRLADDCTIGYIINSLLGVELTVIDAYHSHLEALPKIGTRNIRDQITFSYEIKTDRRNVVNIPGFSDHKDPTRFYSIHCLIYPMTKECLSWR